jgi:hypothetical protein
MQHSAPTLLDLAVKLGGARNSELHYIRIFLFWDTRPHVLCSFVLKMETTSSSETRVSTAVLHGIIMQNTTIFAEFKPQTSLAQTWIRVKYSYSVKRRSLGRYSSLTDSDHGVFFFIVILSVTKDLTSISAAVSLWCRFVSCSSYVIITRFRFVWCSRLSSKARNDGCDFSWFSEISPCKYRGSTSNWAMCFPTPYSTL